MPRRSAIDQSALASIDHVEIDETIMTGEAVALDLRPASFVLRSAGALIDFVVYIGFYLLLMLFALPALANSLNLDDAILTALGVAGLVIAVVVAPITVELLSHGRSLGKLAVGARIVRDDGGAIGFRHAFIRALTGVVEIYTTFGGFAVVVSLLNARSKRLGDLLAGTYSQYERVSKADRPVYGVPTALEQWALTADVARMPDRLARRISTFLAQASQHRGDPGHAAADEHRAGRRGLAVRLPRAGDRRGAVSRRGRRGAPRPRVRGPAARGARARAVEARARRAAELVSRALTGAVTRGSHPARAT
jgi:uncharacterized RDD family membrane protein YckC